MTGVQPKGDVAVLRAFDAAGREIVREEFDLHEYWDHIHPLLDSKQHRASLGVARVVGDLYSGSRLFQHFETRYGPLGESVGYRAEYEDGTVEEG